MFWTVTATLFVFGALAMAMLWSFMRLLDRHAATQAELLTRLTDQHRAQTATQAEVLQAAITTIARELYGGNETIEQPAELPTETPRQAYYEQYGVFDDPTDMFEPDPLEIQLAEGRIAPLHVETPNGGIIQHANPTYPTPPDLSAEGYIDETG
ncbi:MAG: hypothetical protein KatS3mg015_2952 [Fimbriimonadales bacterium]|nr:MAG: hypothetical protein KatS3mg015_2952 [Fimbriimonadales bacterium]